MRKFVPIALVGLLSFGISFAAVKKVPKGEKNIHRFEGTHQNIQFLVMVHQKLQCQILVIMGILH